MTQQALDTILFPPHEAYRTGMLAVSARHTLYWEESGNPNGLPVIFLHGGPGGSATPKSRRFFDPTHYRIVMFDQRGGGRSTPLGEYRDNTTPDLIADIEQLRIMLGIDQWLVFGGSWGSTLSLAYGQAHPEACLGFVLRGIFLCTPAEIDWFLNGIAWFFPEVHAAFVKDIPAAERHDILAAYQQRLFSDDPAVYGPAARSWSCYEGSCVFLRPDPATIEEFSTDAFSLGLARMEAHYFLNQGFFSEDQLIRHVDRLRHLPAVIVQGRYDVVCPPASASRLHHAWPEATLHMIADAGHAALEPGSAAALVAATEQFRQQGRFS